MKRLLTLAFASSIAFATSVTPTNVSVDASSPEPIIRYTDHSGSACSIEISEGTSIGTLIHDVDTTLFAGSNLDSRAGSITNGASRQFVVGWHGLAQRAYKSASDNKYYSRASQAFTQHTFRITCPAGAADGSSYTGNYVTPNVSTSTFTYPTAFEDPANPGVEAIPTFDFGSRTQKIIDPVTKIQMSHMSFINQEQIGSPPFDVDFSDASGVNWSNPTNALANDGSFATYGAGGQDSLCVRSNIVFDSSSTVGGITFELTGKVDDSSSSPQQDVEVAMTLDGCQTANSPWLTMTLPKNSSYSGQTQVAGDDKTSPTPIMAAWLSSGQAPPTVLDISMRQGTVNTAGTSVDWNNQGGGAVFPTNWTAGTPFEINTGSGFVPFTMASEQTALHLTLNTSAGTNTNVPFRAKTFGFMIRPKVAAARTVSLEYARMWVNSYATIVGNGGDGMSTMCSMKATPEGAVVTGASNAAPIQITVSPAQSWTTGTTITVAGVQGNTAANGTWAIHRVDSTHFTLDTSTGSGGFTKHGIAYLPNARTGYQCALLTSRPGDWQYYWVATSDGSGDTHYLGPLWVSGVSGGDVYSGICSGNTVSWDWVTDTVFPTVYCVLPDNVSPTRSLLLSATYIGNPNLGFNADVGALPNQGNAGTFASWDIQVLSSNLNAAYAAFDARYDTSIFPPGNVDGFEDGHVTLLSRAGTQDTMGWRIVFNPVTKTVSGMMASMYQMPAAYCSIHTANTNTFNPWIATTLKNLIFEGGGSYNGPYNSQITSNGGSGVGSVSATLSDCATAIAAIGQTNALGVTGTHCSTVTVGSEPRTPASVIPANSILMPAPLGQTMQFIPNNIPDPAGPLNGERVRLLAKNGSTWVIQRGYYSQVGSPPPPAAQPAGSYLQPICGALVYQMLPPLNEDCCLVWWDWKNDPHALNPNDPFAQQGGSGTQPFPADASSSKQICSTCTMRKEDTFVGLGHFATGSNQDQSVALTFNDSGGNINNPQDAVGFNSPFWQSVAIRWHPWPGQLTEYNSTPIGITTPFSGVYGDCVGNCADIHPSTNYTTDQTLLYSANPGGAFPGWPGTITPLGGQLYKVTNFLPAGFAALDMKRNQLLIQIGHGTAVNVSGPGCSIGTGSGDSWKWGLVYKANECVSGSVPGEVYVNAPGITPGPVGSFIAGIYTAFDKAAPYAYARDLVVMIAGSLTDNYVQMKTINAPDVAGIRARKLTTALNGTKNLARTANYRPLADGTFAWLGWQANQGGSNNFMLIKTPPFPPDSSLNRADYIQKTITLKAPAGLTVDNAVIYFGYDENLTCANRTGESCVAAASNNPYWYSSADAPITGIACSSTCTATINAIPHATLYWQVHFRNSLGIDLRVSAVNVMAVP